MDGGARQAAVPGVAKSQTGLGDFTFTFHFHALEKEMATHSDGGAWWAAVYGVAESDTTEVTQQQQQGKMTECGPLEKGMANHFSILDLRTP